MTVRLNDRVLTRIRNELGRFVLGSVRIGFLGDPELATIAAVHELGSSSRNIPKRPFIRTGLERGRSTIAEAHRKIVGDLMEGRITAEVASKRLGEVIRREIVKAIDTASSWAVALKRKTVLRKGSSAPLVDSGELRNALRVEVKL